MQPHLMGNLEVGNFFSIYYMKVKSEEHFAASKIRRSLIGVMKMMVDVAIGQLKGSFVLGG